MNSDELGYTVANAGRGQINDARVEGKASIEAFAHIVEDRNITDRSWQNLAASARRRAEHDVAAGKCVTDRRDLSRLAAEDVEDANPVVARGNFIERGDSQEVRKTFNAAFEHTLLRHSTAAYAAFFRPRCAAICARPPAFIHSSTFFE